MIIFVFFLLIWGLNSDSVKCFFRSMMEESELRANLHNCLKYHDDVLENQEIINKINLLEDSMRRNIVPRDHISMIISSGDFLVSKLLYHQRPFVQAGIARSLCNLNVEDRCFSGYNTALSFYSSNKNPPPINLVSEFFRIGVKFHREKETVSYTDEFFRNLRSLPSTKLLAFFLESVAIFPVMFNSSSEITPWRRRYSKKFDSIHRRLLKNPIADVNQFNPFTDSLFDNSPGYYLISYLGFRDAPFVNLLHKVYLEAAKMFLTYIHPALEKIPDNELKNAPFATFEKEFVDFMPKDAIKIQRKWRWSEHKNPHCSKLRAISQSKIRIGVISSYLRTHASGRMMAGVFPHLPSRSFHKIVFFAHESNRVNPVKLMSTDPIVHEYSSKSDEWVDFVWPSDPIKAANSLAEYCLDVIIFAEAGMEPFNWALAHTRFAPVQLLTHGHAYTSGISHGSLDAFVSYLNFEKPSDDFFLPLEQLGPYKGSSINERDELRRMIRRSVADEKESGQVFYSEPLLALPGFVKYFNLKKFHEKHHRKKNYKTIEEVLNRPPNSIGNRPIFIMLQTPYKANAEFDELLSMVLDAVPESILVIKNFSPSLNKWFTPRLTKTIGRERFEQQVIFAPVLDNDRWWSLMQFATIQLDSYPFGGYTTTIEAFESGLPVLTLPHEQLNGRCSAAFLRMLGIANQTVATSFEDYAQKARKLVFNVDGALDEVRKVIRDANMLALLHENGKAHLEWERVLNAIVRDGQVVFGLGTEKERRQAIWETNQTQMNTNMPLHFRNVKVGGTLSSQRPSHTKTSHIVKDEL